MKMLLLEYRNRELIDFYRLWIVFGIVVKSQDFEMFSKEVCFIWVLILKSIFINFHNLFSSFFETNKTKDKTL